MTKWVLIIILTFSDGTKQEVESKWNDAKQCQRAAQTVFAEKSRLKEVTHIKGLCLREWTI